MRKQRKTDENTSVKTVLEAEAEWRLQREIEKEIEEAVDPFQALMNKEGIRG